MPRKIKTPPAGVSTAVSLNGSHEPIHLKIDKDHMTLDDLITLDSGMSSPVKLRDLIARMVTDEQGRFLPEADARARAGRLTIGEMDGVFGQLAGDFKKVSEQVVNPTNGAPS